MKAKKAAKWAIPAYPDLDKQLKKAMGLSDVKAAYRDYKGDPENFKQMLTSYIERSNINNRRMRQAASVMDTVNKSTVPLDSILDYLNIVGGIGYAAKGIETIAKSPGYLAYDLYYLGKTGDVMGALANVAYEIGSWACLGSLPHLMNRYTKQSDRYSVKEASKEFLSSLKGRHEEDKSLEGKVIDLDKRRKLLRKEKNIEPVKEAA